MSECGDAPTIYNGIRTVVDSEDLGDRVVEWSVAYECRHPVHNVMGSISEGQNQSTCMDNGNWSFTEMVVCAYGLFT